MTVERSYSSNSVHMSQMIAIRISLEIVENRIVGKRIQEKIVEIQVLSDSDI